MTFNMCEKRLSLSTQLLLPRQNLCSSMQAVFYCICFVCFMIKKSLFWKEVGNVLKICIAMSIHFQLLKISCNQIFVALSQYSSCLQFATAKMLCQLNVLICKFTKCTSPYIMCLFAHNSRYWSTKNSIKSNGLCVYVFLFSVWTKDKTDSSWNTNT